MDFNLFTSKYPIASAYLPLTLITLDEWVLISVTGPDNEKYMQSQVTADVTQISKQQYLLVAHCDVKGKTLSNLLLFRHGDGFSFIERRSVCDIQLIELKKYAVFSKVYFTINNDLILLGIAGLQARAVMKDLFVKLPNAQKMLINDNSTSLLWFEHPIERFLIVTNKLVAQHIIQTLRGKAQFTKSQQWLALHIEAGIPIIDLPNSRKFIPQAINLQALGGISFKKGCYIGQEMVARAQFRGANKHALWCLMGIHNRTPEIGENLERKIGNYWRRTGTVLAAVRLADNRLIVQAVMSNNLDQNSILRIQNDVNTLSVVPLPYSIQQ